jgi:hypothetical protein
MTDPKTQIHAELMAKRAAGADNKEIIVSACTKLFAAGVIPNQVNVLEVVRTEGSSPSMVTVRKGIEVFWNTIRGKVGALPDILAEGVPEPILEVLKGVAPQLALAADKIGKAWYQEEVGKLREATQTAIDAASGFEQAAKDTQALLDTTSAELARSNGRVEELLDETALAGAEIRRQAELLTEAHDKAHRDNVRIETLESDLRASQKEAALMKDARNQTTKELATARESIAALRAQLEDATTARDAQAKAHASAIDDLKTAHSHEVGRLGYEIAAAKGALEKSESERRVLLWKNGELGGEIRAQAKEIKANGAEADRLKRELRIAQDELVDERARRASNFADAGRLVEWIRIGVARKPAVSAFTDGPERQIAYAVEDVLAKTAPDAEKH